MARNRVIYQSDALFVSQDVESRNSGEHAQLRRVQSANYSFNIARQDVNQFGQLARLDSIVLEAPTVSFDMSYFLGDGFNEQALGFANGANFDKGFISGQIESTSGRNFYILTAPEGVDSNFNTAGTAYSTVGIGNAFLTDYSLEASVGAIPVVSCSFEGSNLNAQAGVSGTDQGYSGFSGAGVDPELGTPLDHQKIVDGIGVTLPEATEGTGTTIPTALRPGDIRLSFSSADGDASVDLDGTDASHVQSVSLSIPMSRTQIDKLGSRFSFARTVDFPINPTLSISAIVSETQGTALTDIINSDSFIDEVSIGFDDSDKRSQANYKLKNLKLESQSISSSIGPNKTVDLVFSVSIGGPDDPNNNVFFSGRNTTAILGNSKFT